MSNMIYQCPYCQGLYEPDESTSTRKDIFCSHECELDNEEHIKQVTGWVEEQINDK